MLSTRSGFRGWFVLLGMLAMLVGTSGCRDLILEDGSRIGDHHITRGRSSPNLTSAEIFASQ